MVLVSGISRVVGIDGTALDLPAHMLCVDVMWMLRVSTDPYCLNPAAWNPFLFYLFTPDCDISKRLTLLLRSLLRCRTPPFLVSDLFARQIRSHH